MTMRRFLVQSIQARWPRWPRWSRYAAGAALAAIAAVCAAAPGDPLLDLKNGYAAYEAKRYPSAIAALQPLVKRIPKLADYAAWFLAEAQYEAKDFPAAARTLEVVWTNSPPSPLAPRAVLLAAKAFGENGQTKDAVDILRKNYAMLSQPAGDLAMANAFSAAGDSVSAAIYAQRVYYGYPASPEAAAAETEIAKLRVKLGDDYPPAMPNVMLSRAFKLLDSGSALRARKELETLVPQLGGTERDLARVRIGVADYQAKETLRAQKYLESLELSSPEPDAERFYTLLQCARRMKNEEEVKAALDQLARLYPHSKWRLEALVAAANSHLLENELDVYEPIYRACYESFPGDPSAAICHWKVVWGHYLRRRPDSADLLRAHLRMFPSSENAPGSLYFLGRLSEGSNDAAAARAYYEEITREYPNYYYTVLARERLEAIGQGAASPMVQQFLRGVAFPKRARTLDFVPNATTKARIERARMLVSAGLDDWAETELRYGAQNEDQPHVLAIELASISNRRAGPDQAIRNIKHYAAGYLLLPLDSAPTDFWKLAFPIPYRADLEKYSKQNGLDPFLMAALIRQESEFNPKVISPANARGLTQIMPATGRELSRRLKVQPYSTARLFQPTVNLQLGTFYLKSMVDHLDGKWEVALAAYNAGLTRAHAWMSWGDFREPAEFIETVPFTETRNYIQTVLRNADVYRRLYGARQQPVARR
jgi:soluble lytic murein transglycosylase